jgi:hypothetical protein
MVRLRLLRVRASRLRLLVTSAMPAATLARPVEDVAAVHLAEAAAAAALHSVVVKVKTLALREHLLAAQVLAALLMVELEVPFVDQDIAHEHASAWYLTISLGTLWEYVAKWS